MLSSSGYAFGIRVFLHTWDNVMGPLAGGCDALGDRTTGQTQLEGDNHNSVALHALRGHHPIYNDGHTSFLLLLALVRS